MQGTRVSPLPPSYRHEQDLYPELYEATQLDHSLGPNPDEVSSAMRKHLAVVHNYAIKHHFMTAMVQQEN